MILKDELYTLDSLKGSPAADEATAYVAELTLNPESRIYKAHFPGMPITPGVCIAQMCVEVASLALECPLDIVASRDIRFLVPVTPDKVQHLSIEFTLPAGASAAVSEGVSVEFSVVSGETAYSRLKLTLGRI